jgi:hypothetical protein
MMEISAAVAERQALGDAVSVGAVNDGGFAEAAEALGVFGLGQVTAASAEAFDLAGGGNFEPLGDRLFRFNAFWTTHKSIIFQKERETYRFAAWVASPKLKCFGCPRLAGNRRKTAFRVQAPDFMGQPAVTMPL